MVSNEKLIERFIEESAGGEKWEQGARSALTRLSELSNKDLDQLTKKEVLALANKLKNAKQKKAKFVNGKRTHVEFDKRYSKTTQRGYLDKLKAFYKWRDKEDLMEEVDFSKLKYESRVKSPREFLTNEEVASVIRATENPKWRALFAVMWEKGLRVTEVRTLRLKDLEPIDEDRAYLFVAQEGGKNDYAPRRVALVSSLPYVRDWLNRHPQANNSEALLFPSSYKDNTPILSKAILDALKSSAKKAGVNGKRIYNHLFRHMWVTRMQSMNVGDAVIKKEGGFSPNSTVLSNYSKLDYNASNDAYFELMGLKKRSHKVDPTKPRTCVHCGHKNPFAHEYCSECGQFLDPTKLKEIVAIDKFAVKALVKLLNEEPRIKEKVQVYAAEAKLQ